MARPLPARVALDDPSRVDALLDECIRRGLVDESGDEVRGSRAWNAWLQKAAEVLNRQVAETGWTPPGHPVRAAVEKALVMKGESFADEERADVVELLTQMELAHMTPQKRAQYEASSRSRPRA